MVYGIEKIDDKILVEEITEYVISEDYGSAINILDNIMDKGLRKQICLAGLVASAIIKGERNLELEVDQDCGVVNLKNIVNKVPEDNPLKIYWNENFEGNV